ncbi:MAG: 5'/3'-nucleotidase SurE [Bacteroidales bacterium]|nr:5'/3'-nucleotidase SurE [Bacteroidales bacterium]
MTRPTILVTNDDGIMAPGLRHLINIVRDYGDVVVVAPDKPQSGMAHAITISTPIRLEKIHEEEGYKEYACNGTPVDCVKAGEKIILERNPDLLVSGINHGSNSSINVIYSGTMAAVLESAAEGIPSIGFSLVDYSMDAQFNHAEKHIRRIIEQVVNNGLPERICLNVNIPSVNGGEIKGTKVCRQAKAYWDETFESRVDPRRKDYYWLTGVFKNLDQGEDTDEHALANNYISVVPVQLDLTAHHVINTLKKWNLNGEDK